MANPDEIEIDETEADDDEAFISYDSASYPSDYTLSVIEEMWAKGDIVVPQFQRKFVWTIRQSSSLIESLLMGLPVPQAFFYVDPESRNLVIDGLQRIMSIVYFFDGYFGDEGIQGKKAVFRLTGLSDKSPYSNKTFDELSDADKRKLKGRPLRVINVKQLGPRDDNTSAYHIFERLNTGGTPLTAQEIRHCVFHGPIVEKLSEVNKHASWRKIIGKANFDKHQKDVELVLRVLAISTRANEYEKPMKEFLNVTMEHNRKANSEQANQFFNMFPRVCDLVLEKLGEKPFNIKGRINASALDSVLGTIMTISNEIPPDLDARYAALKGDNEFTDTLSLSTSDASVIKKRLEVVRRHLIPV
jgi:hypothetical protein